MKILITGGAGFLGSHIVEHFLKNTEAEIVVLDRLSYASSGYDRLRDIKLPDGRNGFEHPRVRVLGCDLSLPIPEGVTQEIGDVDYVIHAAAETHVDNSIIDPLPFYQSNVIGTHNLLWWIKNHQPRLKRALLVSTDETYGPATWESTGNIEMDPFRPANPYAAAKAGGECVAFAYANTYKIPLTVAATMNLYGARQGAEKMVPMCIRRVLNGEVVTIHADPTGTRSGSRFYIHCRNYAAALLWAIQRQVTHADLPIKLHISGEREITNLQLAEIIAGYVGKPLRHEMVNFHQSRPGHDLRYALNDGLIRSMGWSQPINIEKSLEDTVRWYLHEENRHWLYAGIKG